MKIVKPKLTDSEIRLIILSAYYNALKTGDTPLQGKIPRLEHIEYNILNWHFIWLIEHDLLRGVIDECNAGSIASITRISRGEWISLKIFLRWKPKIQILNFSQKLRILNQHKRNLLCLVNWY